MRTIRLTFYDLRDLLSHYQPISEDGAFFWPTRQELVEGEEVLVEIELPDHEEAFTFQCVVMGSLRDHGFEAEPGYLLAIQPDNADKRDQMMEVVGRNIIGSNRRFHARYPKAMAVAWSVGPDPAVHMSNHSLPIRCAPQQPTHEGKAVALSPCPFLQPTSECVCGRAARALPTDADAPCSPTGWCLWRYRPRPLAPGCPVNHVLVPQASWPSVSTTASSTTSWLLSPPVSTIPSQSMTPG